MSCPEKRVIEIAILSAHPKYVVLEVDSLFDGCVLAVILEGTKCFDHMISPLETVSLL